MRIQVDALDPNALKPKTTDTTKLGFGRLFTDRMFTMRYTEDRGWHDARIQAYGPLAIDPAANVLHYAQEIFEGLKAYHRAGADPVLFRPELNIQRLNISAERMCMPAVDADFTLDAIETLVDLERDWIPHADGTSLYIRPTMIGTEPALGVKASTEYLFYVILSPVGSYFPSGFKPVTIEANDTHVRAVRGGIGYAKTAANYAPTLHPAAEAKARGCDQILWLDALERKYVEEMGGMNIFFVIDDTVVTSPLGGTILPGITRQSVIELCKDEGIKVEERRLSIDEVVERAGDGGLSEVFASGTAAVITAVGNIVYKGETHRIADGQPGAKTQLFYKTLTDLQYGRMADTRGWVRSISARETAASEASCSS